MSLKKESKVEEEEKRDKIALGSKYMSRQIRVDSGVRLMSEEDPGVLASRLVRPSPYRRPDLFRGGGSAQAGHRAPTKRSSSTLSMCFDMDIRLETNWMNYSEKDEIISLLS